MALVGGNKSSTSTSTDNSEDYQVGGAVEQGSGIVGGDIQTEFGDIGGGRNSRVNITDNSVKTLTDFGAIEGALSLSKGALDYSSNLAANAFSVVENSNTNALLFGQSALDANRESNELVAGIAGKSIDKIFDANSLVSSALGTVSSTVSSALDKVSAVVKSANTSDSTQTIKYIAIAVVGLGLAFAFSKKWGK